MTATNVRTSASFRADSLVLGIFVLLGTTILQRVLGLYRGVMFCRLLDEQTLGRWAIALGFLTMVTPMLLLGLPGTMGRFVERFRKNGTLRSYLLGIAIVSGSVVGLTSLLLVALPVTLADWIFREQVDTGLVAALGFALIGVVALFFVNDLVSALRQVRAVSIIQFTFSVAFTILGTGWLYFCGGLVGLTILYGVSACIGAMPGCWVIWKHRHAVLLADNHAAPDTNIHSQSKESTIWTLVIPFAISVWMMNLLVNSFDLIDRYMLLYLCPGGSEAGQAAVGQYHSSRILPALIVSLATLVSGVLMPYLSADWEAGYKRRVAYRCKQCLLAVSIVFTTLAAGFQLAAPWLFVTVLAGKYQGGLEVLPATFALCTWSALAMLAQNYLWCAQRGRLISVVLIAGLLINVLLNALLVPQLGLLGAVLGTMFANLFLLCGLWLMAAKIGFPLDRTALWTTLLPGTILFGPLTSLVCVGCTMLVSAHAWHWMRGATRTFHIWRQQAVQ